MDNTVPMRKVNYSKIRREISGEVEYSYGKEGPQCLTKLEKKYGKGGLGTSTRHLKGFSMKKSQLQGNLDISKNKEGGCLNTF